MYDDAMFEEVTCEEFYATVSMEELEELELEMVNEELQLLAASMIEAAIETAVY